MIKSIAISRNTYFIDLEAIIPKSLDFFKDEVHYTDKALDLIAITVSSELNKL